GRDGLLRGFLFPSCCCGRRRLRWLRPAALGAALALPGARRLGRRKTIELGEIRHLVSDSIETELFKTDVVDDRFDFVTELDVGVILRQCRRTREPDPWRDPLHRFFEDAQRKRTGPPRLL